jgi:hypothetical protein
MKLKNIYDTHKGRVEININILENLNMKTVKNIFSKMAVIRAENDFISNKITYWAISEEFREVEEGEIIPFYEVEINLEKNGEGKLINSNVKFIEREG